VLGTPNLSLLLIMACFWAVFLLVTTQLVRPLGALLDERERQVREAREQHETARQTVADAIARCERELAAGSAEAGKQRAALRAQGESARRAALEAARAQAQERLALFGNELEQAARDARASLRERSAELARELASRLLGRRVA
jgi:F0F1-type ATP synthase membrane subunit b/b'